MKKLLFFLILTPCSVLFSQTLLTSYPLELTKSKDFQQTINAENTKTHDVYVFASDKETITILKYNTALFLSSNFTTNRPDLEYKELAGYSFNEEGNPTLYWCSRDFKKWLAVQYDLNAKNTVVLQYQFSFFNESIVTQFQANNIFYILSEKDLEQKLVLYIFKDGKKEEKILDFSTFKFKNKKTEPLTLNEILEVCPITKIETNEFTPLFKGTQKTKMYVFQNRMLLTFDHNYKETQAFDIDLTTFDIKEKIFPQPAISKQNGLGNSFYCENKIYQLIATEDEFKFDIKDYKSANSIQTFQASKTDTIAFKNSPLFIQMDGQQPKELKNTSRFLQRLVFLNAGLTVYKTQKEILVTIGGTSDTESGFFDTSVGFNAAMSGNFINVGDLLVNAKSINLYFESVFDKKLQHSKKEQEPLAVDFISRFINEHREVTLQNTIRYKNYYIFEYYDSKAKQYIMRKFKDGFDYSF
ncbi:hypothetical protein [Flavobacterium sp. N3904]|uniref:hypothetical protein n=1 Tax=Flavobacterium sp. N3904 TaxID=2986835 RepID=UPI002224BDFF|nr:hypothetical protein [Flavobacterium sp. N3904]